MECFCLDLAGIVSVVKVTPSTQRGITAGSNGMQSGDRYVVSSSESIMYLLKPIYMYMYTCSFCTLQYRFRLKGLPGMGSISVHVSKQNKSRHYQKVADIRAHHYE